MKDNQATEPSVSTPLESEETLEEKTPDPSFSPPGGQEYYEAIMSTSGMVWDQKAQELAAKYGMQVMNVTWEDTGRYKNSAVGPNISDMTIQVGYEDPRTQSFQVALMPVIRYPNFEDLSTDLSPWDFTLLVGNQNGMDLQRISLYEFLNTPKAFLSDPDSWPGNNNSLLAPRDEKVLVSAQACFLPVPRMGKAVFNPVLFNYQSYDRNPAVLTILVTREGTSVTIIDNTRDAFDNGSVWGQRLFHNKNGQRASLTGERESEFLARPENAEIAENTPSVGQEKGLNMVLMIQVPLKFKAPVRSENLWYDDMSVEQAPTMAFEGAPESDVENAVIGSGAVEGPFTEIDGVAIERDPNFPVRVTVQFYKATSNGIMSEADMEDIAGQIRRVFDQGEYVSSLVTGGETGRPTEYYGSKVQPADWWDNFWENYEKNFGVSREEARRKLRELIGPRYFQEPVTELYLRDVLRSED
jgi:hypothetical protein